MKILVLTIVMMALAKSLQAQIISSPDSATTLQEVIVKAYESNRKLIDVPAAVSVVMQENLNRHSNTNILPAVNANPGVRMEERSPGSYRLSIRGSTLRSPFGVRNVKVYYNDIPYTDPGGNTYLNQLGFYNIQSLEILKGPGSSLYGAGNGGVVLIRNDVNEFKAGASVNYTAGSFNLQSINGNVRFGKDDQQNTLNYQHQTSDGYRQQTKMRRDVFTYDAILKTHETNQLAVHFLYSDLFYQTPGALTKSEYNANPKSARPAAGSNPGAIDANAAIYQKTFLAGLTYNTQLITSTIKNITTLYGAFTQLKNPAIRNYERRSEPHTGGRTIFQYVKDFSGSKFTMQAGAELQKGFSGIKVYKNKQGNPDSLQTDDEVNNLQAFVFAQAILELQKGWVFTAGASLNKTQLEFNRLSTVPFLLQKRNFNNELTPRVAVLRKILPAVSLYGCISEGFSPPTTAEVLPSTGIINADLQAEKGLNYELGTRGSFINNKFYFDINAFLFRLKNTIVQRRDTAGADYFANAGSAKENGTEAYFSYQIIDNKKSFFNYIKLWTSYTLNDFHYVSFKQENNDYSGKHLPGVAPQTIAAGLDVFTRTGIYTNISYFYSDHIALNDANAAYASSYNLLGARLGYKSELSKKINIEIFASADNLLNEKYSLGNDINAAGGRYYNAAPGTNYSAGILFRFDH